MKEFRKEFQAIWANLDPNGHMRHTAYNDYAAQVRLNFFDECGFPFARLIEMGIGPVLFREETQFMREIRINEIVSVDFALLKARRDASKWTFRQCVFKQDGTLSAVIEVDGAWLDLKLRKVAIPPPVLAEMLEKAPKADDFEWLPDKQ
ncbi:MAG: thioesterase family protein [Cyclobacteriaceae bacterium]|nr:thioesterase family protein [Cyclobacteriaceae bacterium HetDA_MAG_MS6]